MRKKAIIMPLVALGLISLISCNKSEEPKEEELTVIFDENYEGGKKEEVKVKKNEKVEAIADPTRDGYNFTGWYTLKETSDDSLYNFENSVTESFTLYAGWIDLSNSCVVTFYNNYEGANDAVYTKVYVEKGKRISSMPENPTREGDFGFSGWYKEAECINKFSTLTKINEDTSLYALWETKFTFEAEYTQLIGITDPNDLTVNGAGEKLGVGYSNNVSGLALIGYDSTSAGAQASNGAYITNLYYTGAFIEFVINSSDDISDVNLQARLSAEYFNFSLSSDEFLVTVNDEEVSYNDINFTNVITDMASEKKRPFSDYYLNTISLKKGENKIRFTVNNSEKLQATGSMTAKAPMIDCIYLTTNKALSWNPYLSNISK